MGFEKRNVVEKDRTPDNERKRADGDWAKTAAAKFNPHKSACRSCECARRAKKARQGEIKGKPATFGPKAASQKRP